MTDTVFPAYAGVNPSRARRRFMALSIPRVCGGEPDTNPSDVRFPSYSPRMRG